MFGIDWSFIYFANKKWFSKLLNSSINSMELIKNNAIFINKKLQNKIWKFKMNEKK